MPASTPPPLAEKPEAVPELSAEKKLPTPRTQAPYFASASESWVLACDNCCSGPFIAT